MGTIRQEPIIGYLHNNRVFYVNLLTDYTYSFTWSNGEYLTDEEKNSYCIQILSAQNKLENMYGFILRGRGMAQYGYWNNWPWSQDGKAGIKTDKLKYYQSGKVDRPISQTNCHIKTKADIDK